jgi:hypothetical protein
MYEAFGLFHPAEVAVAAGEGDLVNTGAAHERGAVRFAGFVEGEAVKGELDV